MNALTDILNSRELAYLIWGIIATLIISLVKEIRNAIIPLIQQLFDKKFLVVYFCAFTYLLLATLALKSFGLWDKSLLKETTVWAIFAMLPLIFHASQAKKLSEYFLKMLREMFQITVVIEFILGLHTLSLWLELLLVPFTIFLTVLIFFSDTKIEHKPANKLFKRLSITLAFFVALEQLEYVLSHTDEFMKMIYLKQLMIPIEYGLLFIPFLYLFAAYVRFEESFTVIGFQLKSSSLLGYAKLLAFRHFFTDLNALKRWRFQLSRMPNQTKQDIRDSIKHIKDAQKREQNIAIVAPEFGWSPYLAKDFLVEKGIITEYYMNTYADEWNVSAPVKRLNDHILGPGVSFHISGTMTTATMLSLRLIINSDYNTHDSHQTFLDFAALLYVKTFGNPIPSKLTTAILNGKKLKEWTEFAMISCKKVSYVNALVGYEIQLKIRHNKHDEQSG